MNTNLSKLIPLILLFITCSFIGKAQNIIIQYDPNFPNYVVGEENIEMQKYAKTHPPVPNPNNFSSHELYQLKLEEWLNLNSYSPQFIPYHLFKRGLTAQDDIIFFEEAKKIWNNAHPSNLEEY